MALDDLLGRLVGPNVSDIHFKAGRPPLLRKNARLAEAEGFPSLSADDTLKIAHGLLRGKQREEFESGLSVDTSYQLGEQCRFRVNVFRQRRTVTIILRQIPMTAEGFRGGVRMCLPFVLYRLGWYPATASAPLVTTLIDASGVLIYFGIATMVLPVG